MKTKKIVMSALLAALVCVATMIIRLPSPLSGYLNLGDGIVLLCGWLLSPVYGFLAAGIGSGLADILSGYVAYAPATFVIKGGMALLAYWIGKSLRTRPLTAKLVGGVTAELVMIGGYLLFESFIYGFVPSLVNIPANAVQGLAGLVVGLLLVRVFEKHHIIG
jgi:uncharacterized membrane protein